MKRLIYLITLMLVFGLVFAGCDSLSDISQVPVTEQGGIVYETKHTEGEPFTTDLIAGGGNVASAIDVGDVLVWNDADTLYVRYNIAEPDWCMTETHLHVATSLEGIPQKEGNPPPGKFEYKEEHVCATEYTYEIPIEWDEGEVLYIAAHAVVEKLCLPETVGIQLTWPPVDSYFTTNILSPTLNGSFDGWCADAHTNISLNTTYANTYIYSSLDGVNPPDCVLVRPWGSLNWILNHWQDNPSNSWQDAQVAIWTLIHEGCEPGGYPCTCIFTSEGLVYTPANVEELLEMACSNSDYVPESAELVAVILLVDDACPLENGEKQMTFFGISRDELYCQSETAWGDGLDFPGTNWATYFKYAVQ